MGVRTFSSDTALDRIERIRLLAEEQDTITVGMVRRECRMARNTAYQYLHHMTMQHILRPLQDHTGWVLERPNTEVDDGQPIRVQVPCHLCQETMHRDALVAALFGPARRSTRRRHFNA